MAGKGNGGGGGNQTFWLDFEIDDRLGFYVESGGDKYLTTSSSFKVVDTNWHHILGTYDGSTQQIWLDGALVASASFAGSVSNNAHSFQIGKGYSGGGEPFLGSIDDVGYWTNGLIAGEAIALYQLGISSSLMYNAAQANSLFEVYHAAAGSDMVNGRNWAYATGLTGPLGIPVFGPNDLISLRLDDLGNGVLSQIPEPSAFALLGLGAAALVVRARRRRG